MRKITVQLKERSYDIAIGINSLVKLSDYAHKLKLGAEAYIITNKIIADKYGKLLRKNLSACGINNKFCIISDTEKSKSLETFSAVINDLARYGKKRKIFIIAFGGGVVGDLAGFVASTYRRGIPYIQIPTTLLAQVDSGIGGKTGIDLKEGKNLIGSFYQPKIVLSDPSFLKSLDLRQIRSGLSEVTKYGIIKDTGLFLYLEQNYKDILSLKLSCLEHIVECCSLIKAKIVEKDEKEEKGIRAILNFGHTIGHAIESAAKYQLYNHGEAIALGMLVAADISVKMGILRETVLCRIEKLIKNLGLPTKIKKISLLSILNAHYYDKKFIGEKNRFILIEDIGKTKIVENIPLNLIKKSLKNWQKSNDRI